MGESFGCFGQLECFGFEGLPCGGGVKNLEGADELDLVCCADAVFLNAMCDVVFDLLDGELARFEVVVVEEELSESVFVGFDGAPAISAQEEFLFEGGQSAFVPWIFADFGFGRLRHERHGEVLWDVVAGLEGPVQNVGGQVSLEESESSMSVGNFPGFMGGVPSAPVNVVNGMQVLADELLGQMKGDVVGVIFDEAKDDARG